MKNGHYGAVKVALSSNEDYNLDQEVVMSVASQGREGRSSSWKRALIFFISFKEVMHVHFVKLKTLQKCRKLESQHFQLPQVTAWTRGVGGCGGCGSLCGPLIRGLFTATAWPYCCCRLYTDL